MPPIAIDPTLAAALPLAARASAARCLKTVPHYTIQHHQLTVQELSRTGRASDRSSDAVGSARAANARDSRFTAPRRRRSAFSRTRQTQSPARLGWRRQQKFQDLPRLVARTADTRSLSE